MFLSADIETYGHIGSGPGCTSLTEHGKATEPREDEVRERVGQEKQGGIQSKTRKELELSEVQGMCPQGTREQK